MAERSRLLSFHIQGLCCQGIPTTLSKALALMGKVGRAKETAKDHLGARMQALPAEKRHTAPLCTSILKPNFQKEPRGTSSSGCRSITLCDLPLADVRPLKRAGPAAAHVLAFSCLPVYRSEVPAATKPSYLLRRIQRTPFKQKQLPREICAAVLTRRPGTTCHTDVVTRSSLLALTRWRPLSTHRKPVARVLLLDLDLADLGLLLAGKLLQPKPTCCDGASLRVVYRTAGQPHR